MTRGRDLGEAGAGVTAGAAVGLALKITADVTVEITVEVTVEVTVRRPSLRGLGDPRALEAVRAARPP